MMHCLLASLTQLISSQLRDSSLSAWQTCWTLHPKCDSLKNYDCHGNLTDKTSCATLATNNILSQLTVNFVVNLHK